MKRLILALLLSGCTNPGLKAPSTTENVPANQARGFECIAEPVQYAVGKNASAALAQDLMTKSGAEILRWIPPHTAVTMDFSPVRLNIGYDDNMIIDSVSCG